MSARTMLMPSRQRSKRRVARSLSNKWDLFESDLEPETRRRRGGVAQIFSRKLCVTGNPQTKLALYEKKSTRESGCFSCVLRVGGGLGTEEKPSFSKVGRNWSRWVQCPHVPWILLQSYLAR